MEDILHLPLMDHFKVLDPHVSKESPRTKFAKVETVLHEDIARITIYMTMAMTIILSLLLS